MPQQSRCSCNCHDFYQSEKDAASRTYSDAQAMIDERIASLKDDIRALKTILNRCLPISSLPTENLTQILFHIVSSTVDLQKWTTCVELTRVCTHWRNIAMQFPALWSHVSLPHVRGPVKYFEEMLARSKSYPLSIRINPRNHDPRRFCDDHDNRIQRMSLLRIQAYRIRQLNVQGDLDFLQNYQDIVLEETLSCLESLSISVPAQLGAPTPQALSQSPFVVQHVLNNQTMPSLHHLSLRSIPVSPDWSTVSSSSLGVRNLTSLSLFSSWGHNSQSIPPYPHLLDILRALPRLQHLSLFNYIADGFVSFEHSGTPTAQKVHLPCLTSMEIDDRLSLFAPFLSYLLLPLKSRIHLRSLQEGHLHSTEDRRVYIRDIFRHCSLNARDGRTQARRYEIMSLYISDGNSVELNLHNRNTSSQSFRSNTHTIADTQNSDGDDRSNPFVLELWTHSINEYTTVLLDEVDQSLQTLNIFYDDHEMPVDMLNTLPETHPDYDESPPVNWQAFFKKSPSIRTVSLHWGGGGLLDTIAVLDALGRPSFESNLSVDQTEGATDTLNPDLTGTGHVLLPYLERLSFRKLVLEVGGKRTQAWDSLTTMLRMRRENNSAIPYITLDSRKHQDTEDDWIKREIQEINGEGTVF